MRILVGTDDGLREVGLDGIEGPRSHAGRTVSALGAEYPGTWVILDGSEIWRVGDGSWARRGSLNGVRANCFADTRAGYLVGTSEAHLYTVEDDGVRLAEPFEQVKDRDRWYTPWGGPPDVRSLTEDFDVVMANVHVGGIVRTLDEGASWEPTIEIDADVHRVWARDGLVSAATAWGLAQSTDRGDTWQFRDEGLHASYCRAAAPCGEAVLVSASNGPRGGRSALYRGAKAAGPLERCREGLPEWFDDNIDTYLVAASEDDDAVAFGMRDGRIFLSHDTGATWDLVATDLPAVQCLSVP